MLDYTDVVHSETILDPKKSKRKVIGIDIDIRDHNREAINAHPLSHEIKVIQGSSIANEVAEEVHQKAEGVRTILVCLDSNHTHDHVLEEIEAYSNLVSINIYLVVFDTVIEYLDEANFPDRPWRLGSNPKTAVDQFITSNKSFEIDCDIDAKLQISVAPGGFLKRIK